MKKIVFILFFVFLLVQGYSRYVYYGYPTNNETLKKGDIVILNIPLFYLSGGNKFIKMEEFDSLVSLLKTNDTNTLRIEINYFYGDSLLSEGISSRLYENIKEILELKTILKNYYIVNNGCRNPIFFNEKKDDYYMMFNSRIEIIVE